MDPQSVVFHPQSEFWRFQNELQRLQAVQAEHGDRILRVERKQDDDARMKSVWGGASPFPGILSGTPQHTPLHQASAEAFKSFDDEESANLIGSLHLDPEEEPRRIGATSRANSVRFDESANHGHWAHTSRSSMDLMRSSGGVPMSERTSSHKSDGRASSAHSIRSAASGRANSLSMDAVYNFGDSRSLIDNPGLAPGLLLLGSVPAIIRCWMNTDFKHNALLYAAVCTGSYRSFLDSRLVDKLGYANRIVNSESGPPTVTLSVYLPEAIPHPNSTRSGSPAPQLPTLTVTFTVFDASVGNLSQKGIQIIIGSDALRIHNADILFSTNRVSLFDDERNKLSIPLVRPEDETTFSGLSTANHNLRPISGLNEAIEQESLNGLGQRNQSSAESVPALATGIIGLPRSSGVVSANFDPNASLSDSSEDEKAPRTGRSIRFASTTEDSAATDSEGAMTLGEREQQSNDGSRVSSSPAIWGQWRQRGAEPGSGAAMDYATVSKQKEPLQRKESGMKVLRPTKSASRSFSATLSSSNPNGDGKSRYFDDGKKKGSVEITSGEQRREGSAPVEASIKDGLGPGGPVPEQGGGGKARTNPAGGASAFSWLKSGAAK
ncbi:hypothetical protein ANO11243_052630 [Dothideomycetidae sp. 11243]|nr:hypothetical protein ANO11243_052630 [fungal sp. No.11243]